MRRRWTRTRLLELLVAFATGVVIVLLVLIGTGILVLPSSSSATVTITAAQWHLEQGTTKFGFGWFGPDVINSTEADGLPIQVASGATFQLALTLSNLDSVNHTIYSVTAGSPFQVTGSTPHLPALVLSGADDWNLAVTIAVPSVASDSSYSVELTVVALVA
jgi:hypothetical protein